ncbi:hypothetical protein O181_077367 [Austropuccinia psidii MF-1]|uniref:Uncharacterized protein n=1 Tax=Austropuccinia psidii MF-1 TaxID=1389203 RepID=A0A9Q3FFV2_9BASI|nr:hypothetical protein [Austropuccinia psidii MF-1]
MGIWSWANNFNSTPSSPPALAALSRSSSPSPSSEGVPKAAMAFYAFTEGSYNPQIFVPYPFYHFLGNETLASSSVKAMNTHPVSQKKPLLFSLTSQLYWSCHYVSSIIVG